jgi:NADH-quinone oxidoreductase subunit G
VWGEGCDFALLPPSAKGIHLGAWRHPDNARADVFLPISVQTERSGHYTNFAGVISRFDACFARPAGVIDAETLFAALAQTSALPALLGAT